LQRAARRHGVKGGDGGVWAVLKGSEPPLQEWQIDQAREALRCLQKGIENWEITATDAEENVGVRSRVKTRDGETAADEGRSMKEGAGMMPAAEAGPETCVGRNADLPEASGRQARPVWLHSGETPIRLALYPMSPSLVGNAPVCDHFEDILKTF
jgi:hypothetical protein